jgi:hypothetical protein
MTNNRLLTATRYQARQLGMKIKERDFRDCLNASLDRLLAPHLSRPVGRPPKSGIQITIVDLHYQAKSWS